MPYKTEPVDSLGRNSKGNQFKNNKTFYQPQATNTIPLSIRALKLSPAAYAFLGLFLATIAGIAVNFTSTYPPLLIVGGTLGLILAITVFQKPEMGGYILILSVFMNISDLFTEKGLPSINKPLVAIVVLSVFANYILRTGKIRPFPKLTRAEFVLAIYLLTILLSSFVAVNQSKSLTALFDLVKDIVVGYCIYITLDTRTKINTGLNILLGALAFVSLLGIIRTVTGSSNNFWGLAQLSAYGQISDTDGQLRYAGAIGESNIWGQVLASSIPIALYKIIGSRDIRAKFLFILSGAMIVTAMILTESRGAFLATAIVLILIAIDLRIRSTSLLIISVTIFLMLLILPAKYTDRIKSLGIFFQNQEYGLTQDESIAGRQAKMLIGLAMFRSNPFLGVGFANYSDNYWLYAGKLGLGTTVLNVGTDAEGEAQQPHSLYVEVMAETGIFGIASFLGFLGLIFYELLQLGKKIKSTTKSAINKDWLITTSSIMMSIITYLIAGFFLHGIGFRYIWVLIGISLAVIHTELYLIDRSKKPSVL